MQKPRLRWALVCGALAVMAGCGASGTASSSVDTGGQATMETPRAGASASGGSSTGGTIGAVQGGFGSGGSEQASSGQSNSGGVGAESAEPGGSGPVAGPTAGNGGDPQVGPVLSGELNPCIDAAELDPCSTEGEVCDRGGGDECACRSDAFGLSLRCDPTCPSAQPSGECGDALKGLICNYGSQTCRCMVREPSEGEFTVSWECAEAPTTICPAEVPESAASCTRMEPTDYAIDPCIYPDAGPQGRECYCVGTDSPYWSCRDRACPAGLPSGTCAYQAGLQCDYPPFDLVSRPGPYQCECEPVLDTSLGDWVCDGQPTPECPEVPSDGSACTDFAEPTYCVYETADAGRVTTCRCQNGSWICSAPPIPGDPVSSRSEKRAIEYLSSADVERLAHEVSEIKLARYAYVDPQNGRGPQLGFLIDDMPSSAAVAADGRHVNLYAYASMLVAANQEQGRRIEQLERQVAELVAVSEQRSGRRRDDARIRSEKSR